MTSIPT